MSDRMYQDILKNFEAKTTRELNVILEDRDSGEWSEYAIRAAESILSNRPDEEDSDLPFDEPPLQQTAPRVFELSEEQRTAYRKKIQILGWAFCALAFIPLLWMGIAVTLEGLSEGGLSLFLGGLALAAVLIYVGSGLIRLRRSSRAPGLLISIFLVFLFPVGTIIGWCGILWLGKRGEVLVDSPVNGTEQADAGKPDHAAS